MLVLYIEGSGNKKLGAGACDATYAPIATCGPCGLKDSGCHAKVGRVGMVTGRLDAAAAAACATPLEIARAEARSIDAAYQGGKGPPGRQLRLHVSGDASTDAAARALGGAAKRWTARGGGPVWTYTHTWRTVSRASWGSISVLGSIEQSSNGLAVLAAGYAPALVVEEFPNGAKAFKRDGVRYIPCPNQTAAALTCSACGLCMDAGRLAAQASGIAFAAHGISRKRVLTVLQ